MEYNNQINCDKCGAHSLPDARFCVDCGQRISKIEEDISDIHTISDIETDPNVGGNDSKRTASFQAIQLEEGASVANKYEIEKKVGQGGMGAVYKAVELVTGNSAAIKIVSPNRPLTDFEMQRLINEGVTVRKISHPNVVQIYDIGLHKEVPYVAMEYVEGLSLIHI